MEQSRKFKINCLKFIIENGISKENLTDFQLAEQLNKWATSDSMELVEKNSQETFDIIPDEIVIPGGNKSPDLENPGVRAVLRKINRDPERMKELGNVKKNSANFSDKHDMHAS